MTGITLQESQISRRELLRIGGTGLAAWFLFNFVTQPTPTTAPAHPVAGVAVGPPSSGASPARIGIDEPKKPPDPTVQAQLTPEGPQPTAIATARRQVEQAEVITDKGYIFMSKSDPPPLPIPDSFPTMTQVRLRKGARFPLQYDNSGRAIVFQKDWVLVNNNGQLGLVLARDLNLKPDQTVEWGLDKFGAFFAVDPSNFSIKRSSPEAMQSYLADKLVQRYIFGVWGENDSYPYFDYPGLLEANGIYGGSEIDQNERLIFHIITKSSGQFDANTSTVYADQNPIVFEKPRREIESANIMLTVDQSHHGRVALLSVDSDARKYVQKSVADVRRLKLALDYTAALVNGQNIVPLYVFFARYNTPTVPSNVGTYDIGFLY